MLPTLQHSVSIIIPAFNEQDGIGDVLNALSGWRKRAEIIVVDDASTDRTAEIAERAGVRVIRHLHNKGYGAALKSGIRAASGEIIVTLDADVQHRVDDIARLLECITQNDMVVGARGKDSHIPILRRPGKWILAQVANFLAETQIPDINSGFRAIRKDTVKRFLHILPNGFSFSTTLTLALFKEGYNVAYVPIVTTPRVGRSTVNPIRDGLNTIMLIVRVIALFDPLKVFLPASAALFLIGLAYWVGSIIYRQTLQIPSSSLIHIPSGAVILLVSSVVIFMFGILADQVSAIRREKYE